MEAARIVDILSKNRVMIIIYNMDIETDLVKILHDAYQRIVPVNTEINFAVLCKFDCIRKLFYTVSRDARNKLAKNVRATCVPECSFYLVLITLSLDY